MKKQLLILIFLIIWALTNAPASRGQTLDEIVTSSAQLAENEAAFDNRIQILEDYLKKYDSPLAEYANEFVEAADAYGLDWRLLVAITGVESTYGKFIPKNSYNAYGWANGAYYFESWPDSIWHVSQALKEKYIDRGADTIYKIGRIYAPPSPFWAGKVIRLMAEIDSEPQFTLDL
jgi:hypothetical protein